MKTFTVVVQLTATETYTVHAANADVAEKKAAALAREQVILPGESKVEVVLINQEKD